VQSPASNRRESPHTLLDSEPCDILGTALKNRGNEK